MQDYITQSIAEGIRLKEDLLNNRQMLADIENVGNLIVQTILQGHKVLLCGNGGSAADAQHIAAELVGRFVTDRRGLPAIAMTTDTSILTAVSNDYGFDYIFERQTEALGMAGDVLIGLSTSGNSPNVERALLRARSLGLTTVGLLGRDGGKCKDLCDYFFIIRHSEAARIQEMHITIGHILCGIVDNKLGSHE
ncbi:D-sedoheptulose 7-phosphate isomerase [Bacteroides sp.]|uniref:D-sedoheptulose 7-phosphate isomerase n=1 Tax=Bacteroides sp. TaxID=29523 RepID=UPI003AB50E21